MSAALTGPSKLLSPLVPLYRAAIAIKNAAYDRSWMEAKRLTWPVVSVGNLSVGGSGKTPLVIRLAQLLSANHIPVDVLSRGYGRRSTEMMRVDPSGGADKSGAAENFGDEPLLIARKAGVPVYVGASRYAAGLLAEREVAGPGIHLLDDGFQHRKLARSMDIVVLHRSDFQQRLLPTGRLREPVSSLHRASAVVLRTEDADLETRLRDAGVQAPVWIQRRSLVVEPCGPAIAFSGIGRPEEFTNTLRAAGVEILAARAFRDHHRYTDADIDWIVQLARSVNAEVCITTEKDAVRLDAGQRAKLAAALSLQVARLEISLVDETAIVERMTQLLVRK